MSSRNNWTTWAVTGYTYDVANDQRSAGGVHLHQIRKTKTGWQARIMQSNGRFKAAGEVKQITEEEWRQRNQTAQNH